MAFWPFKKRAQRQGKDSSTIQSGSITTNHARADSTTPHPGAAPHRKRSKKRRKGKRRDSSPSLKEDVGIARQLEAISPLSSMGSSFIRPPTRDTQHSAEDNITALPQSRKLRTSPHLRPATRNDADIPYDFRLYDSSRVQTPKPQSGTDTPPKRNRLSRSPSRRRYKPAAELPTKLTKAKLKELPKNPKHVREEDFRTMSAPTHMPRRPGKEDTGILRRESQRMREGLNRKFQRPMSDISLPRPDSRPSTRRSDIVDSGRNYRISVFDVLSPRPVIRAQEQPYSMLAIGWSTPPSRSNSGRWSARQTVSSRAGKQPFVPTRLKRVEDLADDMDSQDIRAIMDRERKRQNEKLLKENERLKRRLRMLHDESDANLNTSRSLESSPEQKRKKKRSVSQSRRRREARTKEADVLKREGTADNDQPRDATQQIPEPPQRHPSRLKNEDIPAPLRIRSGKEMGGVDTTSTVPEDTQAGAERPANDEQDIQSIRFPVFGSSASDADETPLPSPISSSYPLKVKLGSRLRTNTLPEPDVPKLQLPISATPSVTALPPVPSSPEKKKRRPSLLFSFFRRGDKKSRARSLSESSPLDRSETSTSFVNVSRDHKRTDLTAIPGSQADLPSRFPVQKERTHTPTRSQSRFRENLPELTPNRPFSPPPSKLQSASQNPPTSPEYLRNNMTTPISRHRTSDKSALSPDTNDLEDRIPKSPSRQQHPFTQSLASIDSEGSWLAGKPVKRMLSDRSATGQNLEPNHESASEYETGDSTPKARHSFSSYGDALPEEEFSRRLTATKLTGETVLAKIDGKRGPKPKRSGDLIGASDPTTPIEVETKGGLMKVHGDLAKQANIQQGLRVRSSEGLLKEMLNTERDDGAVDEYEVYSDTTPKSKKTADRHDSSMPNMADLSLDLDSDEDTGLELQRARSVQTGKMLGKDAKMIEVSNASSKITGYSLATKI